MKRMGPVLIVLGVLLGSAGESWGNNSEKVYKRHYADVELQLPDIPKLCLLKSIGNERVFLDFYKKILEQGGYNKFLLMWVDCKSHKKIQEGTQNGHRYPMSEWVTVLAPYQNGKEQRFPSMSRREYLKKMIGGIPSVNWEDIKEVTNRNLRDINKKYLNTKRYIESGKMTSLGILAVDSAIHLGGTSVVSSTLGNDKFSQRVATVSSYNYVHEFPLNINHYKTAVNNNLSHVVKQLLSQSINYSKLLLQKNE
jgi:hypothetical protein